MKKKILIFSILILNFLNSCYFEKTICPVPKPNCTSPVTIGTQVWMCKNLDVDHYRNGDLIRHCQTNEEWVDASSKMEGAWCYYNNDSANGVIYGRLYNWYAVTDIRGLAPIGWHIPSLDEYRVLTESYGDIYFIGDKLKEIDSTHWKCPYNTSTNESGFSALPGGERFYMGYNFFLIEQRGGWWSTLESLYNKNEAIAFHLNCGSGSERASEKKGTGYSVRCVKD